MLNRFSDRHRKINLILLSLYLFVTSFGIISQEAIQAPSSVEIPVDLLLQGVPSGEILARLPGADLDRLEILSRISSLLNQKNYDTILALESDFISLEFLRKLGLSVEFDEELLVLDVRIKAVLMPPSVIPVRDVPDPIDPERISSAPFSFYMNYAASADFLYEDLVSSGKVTFPARLNLLPVFQLYQWVLEGDITLRTPPETPARLQVLRLVREFPSAGIRLVAGTVDPNWDGIMVGSSSVTAERDGHAFPLLSEIVIEEPSVAEVYLNGRLIKRLRLPMGVHSLSEIPYSSGLNSLRVEVTGLDGTKKIYQSRQPFDANLLPRGDSTFSLSAGIPRFEWDNPLMFGDFSHGLLPWLTAGVTGQTDFNSFIGTMDAIFSSSLGNWRAAASVAAFQGGPLLTSGSLGYRFSFPSLKFAPVVGAGVEFIEPGFRSNLFQEVSSSYRYNLNFSYGQLLPLSTYLNLGMAYRFNDWGEDGAGRISATLLSRLNEAASVSFSYGAEFSPEAPLEWRAALTVSLTPSSAGQSLTVQQDLTSGEASAGFSTSRGNIGIKGFPPAVSETTEVEANLAFRPGYFNVFLGNSFSIAPTGGLKNRFSAGAAGAFLFTGGYFSFSPPVTDSFALIVPPEGGGDQPLRIYGTGITEKEGTGRVTALYELASYRETGLVLDLPEAEPGTVIEKERISLLPSYRSGTLVKPVIRTSVHGEGVINNSEGEILPLTALEIVRWEPVQGAGEASLSFSDERGRFQFHDLVPGEYRISLLTDPSMGGAFSLPAGAGSPVFLGILTLGSREDDQ